jgi:uncharacterized membrane protein
VSATTAFLIACAVIAGTSIPMILKLVPPNPYYGFRTPRTLANRELWFRANRFAGWALLIGAGVSAFLLTLSPESGRAFSLFSLAAFLGPLAIAVVVSFAYVRKYG